MSDEDNSKIQLFLHLRQIHFYLVLLCMLLIIATSFTDSMEIDSAISQAKTIKHIADKWHTNDTSRILFNEGERLFVTVN